MSSNQLTVVSIVLDPNENPHLVFESLNARGKPLTQADLIRNYFFMRMPVDKQEEVFKRDWQPMQDALDNDLTECIRHYLIAMKSTFVKKTEVYIVLKDRIDDAKINILEHLQEIATYASYYQKILYPEREPILNIQRALKRIKRIEVTVAYPFLLRCYHDYVQNQLSEAGFCKILHLIENMEIRRSVCNLPSHGLNKLFSIVYREATSNYPTDFVKGVAHVLQSKSRSYPSDAEFREALTTTNFYNPERREKTKLVLESLESSYQHKEIVDFEKLSVEHIMPQTIKKGSWWSHHLGAEWETVHELYLHTLGNLTLTGYNSELSNKSFPEKQKELAQSHLELNHYFASLSEWKEEQIKQRAEQLADLALKIWPHFGDKNQSVSTQKRHEVIGTKPLRLMIEGVEFPVKSWCNVLEETLNFLAKEKELDVFETFVIESSFVSENSKNLWQPSKLVNGYYIETKFSADRIYRLCQQAMEYFGYSREDWQVDYQ